MNAGEMLKSFAKKLAALVEEEDTPELMSYLPEKDRFPASEKYFAGYLALRNISEDAAGLFQGVAEGATARYGEHCELYVLKYEDTDKAQKGYAAAVDSISIGFEYRVIATGRYLIAVLGKSTCVDIEAVAGKIAE
jgi:hypothetical protein